MIGRIYGTTSCGGSHVFRDVFPHFKSVEANDSMASIDTRSMDGRIYVGDHKTKLWVSPFQRRRFLKVFPIIRLYIPEFQSNQSKNHMHPFPFHT